MSKVYLSRVLELARAEIGYHEKDSDNHLDSKTAVNDGSGNHTKYARDLHAAGYYNGDKCGYAWCDVFVDWLFYMASGKDAQYAQQVQCQTGDLGAGCYYSAGYYKQAGRYHTSNPQPGDQIFFGDFDHTGIVERVEGCMVVTIEGNSNNRVERRTYNIHDSYITGYGRPRYDKEEPEMTKAEIEQIARAAAQSAAKSVAETTGRAVAQAAVAELMRGAGTGDKPSDWAKEATDWAKASGLVEGLGNGDFAWKTPITRQEMAIMLQRLAKLLDKE